VDEIREAHNDSFLCAGYSNTGKPHMGAKELQNILQEQHNCTISYDTVWKGKEKALRELYGTWEDSFKLLFRWREAILEVMPDSVIEFDVTVEDGKIYFSRFFCAFGPCLEGFREGCRPYLSVDSTALNGVDGHNWMFPVAFGFFESETKDSWIWFMQQLRKAIRDPPVLAICSDACKGLASAVVGSMLCRRRSCKNKHLRQILSKSSAEAIIHKASA
jgi:hypothetical protein